MTALKSHFEASILYVEFGKPETANAYGVTEAQELIKILKGAKKKAHYLVWQSALPNIFCSGGDLAAYRKMKNKAEGLKANAQIRRSLTLLAEWPGVKIGLVAGDCLGGGVELLSAFDFIVASSSSRFGFWQRRQTLSYGWGGFSRLTRRLGKAKTKQLLLQGESISAWQAQRFGLVDEVVPSHLLLDKAEKYLQNLKRWPEEPLRALSQLESKNETTTFNQLWFSPKHQNILQKKPR